MNEEQFAAVCTSTCRKLAMALEAVNLYAEPTLSEYKEFRDEISALVERYESSFKAHLRYLDGEAGGQHETSNQAGR